MTCKPQGAFGGSGGPRGPLGALGAPCCWLPAAMGAAKSGGPHLNVSPNNPIHSCCSVHTPGAQQHEGPSVKPPCMQLHALTEIVLFCVAVLFRWRRCHCCPFAAAATSSAARIYGLRHHTPLLLTAAAAGATAAAAAATAAAATTLPWSLGGFL